MPRSRFKKVSLAEFHAQIQTDQQQTSVPNKTLVEIDDQKNNAVSFCWKSIPTVNPVSIAEIEAQTADIDDESNSAVLHTCKSEDTVKSVIMITNKQEEEEDGSRQAKANQSACETKQASRAGLTKEEDGDHNNNNETDVEEEHKLLPPMPLDVFCTQFAFRMKTILSLLRRMHTQQANTSEKNNKLITQEIEQALFEKRTLFAKQLFCEQNMWHDMVGFDEKPMCELFEYIVKHRLRNFKRGYCSRPMSLHRFCPDSSSSERMGRCKLKKLVGWCDMHHVEDMHDGDIVYTKCYESYEFDSITSLVMLKYDCSDREYSPLFLSPIGALEGYLLTDKTSKVNNDSRTRNSFFDYFKGELKHVDNIYYPTCDNNWEIGETELQESKSRYIASFERFLIWVSFAYQLSQIQRSRFVFQHCEFLESVGCKERNFLNLLVNGILPRRILLLVLEQDEEVFKTMVLAQNRVTPDMFVAWMVECGTTVFEWLPQLIERSKNESINDKHLDLTLQELKTAMEVYNYMRQSTYPHETKLPDGVPENIGIQRLEDNQVVYYYDSFDVFRVINHVLQQKDGRDLADLHNYHQFTDWKEKKERN